jgi:hypothetical protein
MSQTRGSARSRPHSCGGRATVRGRQIAGIDLNKPRIRAALAVALALAPALGGFTVAEYAARVRQITG